MPHVLLLFSLFIGVGFISQEFSSVPEEKIPTDSAVANSGMKLFHEHCIQCHRIFKKQIGPPLAYIYRFYDYNWLYGFITNSQQMVAEGDELAVDIFNAYDQVIMPSHDFSKDEVWSILGYVKKVSETRSFNEYFNVGLQAMGSSKENEPGQCWILLILVPSIFLTCIIIYFIYRQSNKDSN